MFSLPGRQTKVGATNTAIGRKVESVQGGCNNHYILVIPNSNYELCSRASNHNSNGGRPGGRSVWTRNSGAGLLRFDSQGLVLTCSSGLCCPPLSPTPPFRDNERQERNVPLKIGTQSSQIVRLAFWFLTQTTGRMVGSFGIWLLGSNGCSGLLHLLGLISTISNASAKGTVPETGISSTSTTHHQFPFPRGIDNS